MKTKGNLKNKINIVTLGCSKNLVDSEVIYTQLKGNGYNVTHESKKDDANEAGVVDKVYVTGCLSHRYKDELEVEIPTVDAWFGTNELPRLLKTLKADYKHELVGERLLTTPAHYAYLKIAEGCDRPCSFCAIPLMRGGHVSQPIETLVLQAKNLAKKGTKELILIAQDLTYYGLDIYKKRELANLIDQLSDVEGIDWIRLQYAYPSGFPMDVLDVMKNRSNVCNYLDMPLQHGSSEMLKLMRRGINREKTEDLIKAIRDKVPDIAIRTTLIAGHPGETEEHFEEMYRFVEQMRFERLGVFQYSHEENTHSHTMADDIPAEIKQERTDLIMELQQGISQELNEQKIGNTYKVLFDRKEGGYFIGRTEFDSPEVDNEVLVPADKNYVRQGDFAMVKINDSAEFDLYGEVV
ncbi:MAG: 30S ribosomal protein S12 methylthiotransferase RimO [Spirosomaceae bacterium]|nr:30S ribosomal protein S12 methylthiotransferase RimO [Spirosomataceae bacterium]